MSARHWRSHAARSVSHSAVSKSPSSSQASKFVFRKTLGEARYLNNIGPPLTEILDCQDYNLQDLRESYGMKTPLLQEPNASEKACTTFLHTLLGLGVTFKTDQELTCLKQSTVSPLLCTKVVRPDVSCHLDGDTTAATLVEIHSSPFEDTVFKAIIIGIDLLRVRKCRIQPRKTSRSLHSQNCQHLRLPTSSVLLKSPLPGSRFGSNSG